MSGVEEELLDKAPSDRPHYTRLGGVVVGTATIAAFSMWVALSSVFGMTAAWAVLPALGWGFFIGNLDAWLISSLHGTAWRRRAWVVLPRVALAFVFGVLIAEPLVLRAFETAIEKKITTDRQTELLSFQTTLRRCNPTDGQLVTDQSCATSSLVVTVDSPQALQAQLDELKAQRTRSGKELAKNDLSQRQLDRLARNECNGTDGAGFSGRSGVGPNCVKNRGDADAFRSSSQRSSLVETVARLDRRIRTTRANLAVATNSYSTALAAAIEAKVAERRADLPRIGLLERLAALSELVDDNRYLAMAEWFLRLLFITIDCLPLIVRVMGGSTSYDRILDADIAAREQIFDEQKRTDVRRAVIPFQSERYRLERHAQHERESLDIDLRRNSAERDAETEAAIDEMTLRMLDRDAFDPV